MDYEEKSELKKEITKSTKRSIKHCIIACIGTLAMETLIWGFLYLMLSKYEQLGMILCAGFVLLGLRYFQSMFIAWFASE